MPTYDQWKSTEPEDFGEKEPQVVPCHPCGGTGQEEVGTTPQGETILDNCIECGGEGFVDK